MATITGRVVNVVWGMTRDFAIGQPVFVRRDGEVIAVTKLDADDEFSVEVDDTPGQLEISVGGLRDTSAVVLDFDGIDAHIEFLRNDTHRSY